MQSDQAITSVENAGALFLSGNFRKALSLGNQLLVQRSSSPAPLQDDSKPPDRADHYRILEIPLETELCLTIDAAHQNRRLSILLLQVDNGLRGKEHESSHDDDEDNSIISDVDRAATVVLQSWYEIARSLERNNTAAGKSGEDVSSQGHVHLLPFLDTYTTNNNGCVANQSSSKSNPNKNTRSRSMPLELAVIFARFLRTSTIASARESVELSCEILYRVSATYGGAVDSTSPPISKEFLPQHVRNCCEDLFSLIFVETLPFSSSKNAVLLILERFLSSNDSTWKSSEEPLALSGAPKLDSILAILLFFDKPSKNWSQLSFPGQDCIQASRSSLRRFLKALELENRQGSVSGVNESVFSDGKRRIRFASEQKEVSSLKNNLAGSPRSDLLSGRTKIDHGATEPSVFATLVRFSGNAKELIYKLKDKKGSLAFVLVMIILAWRKRQRVTSVSSAALRLFLAPIREVVEAILKPT